MNKLLGYIELELSTGVIPVKIGCYTLEKFCESYGIGLVDIGSVFEVKEYKDAEGNQKTSTIPKDPIKFLSLILFHGANYASKLTGGKEFIVENAYEWADEIGLSSPISIKVMTAFIGSIMNGGSPVRTDEEPDKKKEQSL
ncbi:hypothetical protein [Pedobacter sp.]|uniref:hypothetical protein n=1 Tax=Pedobacter sp. TaxID=1411316 RepID=UPI003C31FF4F